MVKKSRKRQSRWHRFTSGGNLIILLLALVVLIAVGFGFLNNQLTKDREKTQFMQAKTDLHDLYSEIVSKIGQPQQHKSVQNCSYTSSEFTKGYLYCGVSEYFFYSANTGNLQGLAREIDSLIQSSSKFKDVQVAEAQGSSELTSRDFSIGSINRCASQYLITDNNTTQATEYPDFLGTSEKGLSIGIGCTSPAKAEYFPVLQN